MVYTPLWHSSVVSEIHSKLKGSIQHNLTPFECHLTLVVGSFDLFKAVILKDGWLYPVPLQVSYDSSLAFSVGLVYNNVSEAYKYNIYITPYLQVRVL